MLDIGHTKSRHPGELASDNGPSGGTRTNYTADLRIFAGWMEQAGRMPSTIARRLSTLSSFYKYCRIEDIVDRNPAANIRRPKVNEESRALGLDRNELGALLVQAGLGDPETEPSPHSWRSSAC